MVARDRFKYRFRISELRRELQLFLGIVVKMSFKLDLNAVAEFVD